jgi:hypothetical protein
MTITQRPPYFAAVGGVLANPVTYRLDTTHAYLSASLYTLDGALIGTLKAAARQGVVTLDVSAFLRARLQPELPATSVYVTQLPGSCLGYYATFAHEAELLNDIGNPRYAVLAALPFGESMYEKYVV